MPECPVCLEKITNQPSPVDNDSVFYDCPLCGKYFLSNSVGYGGKLPHTASAWIQEQNRVNGKPPLITSDKYEMLKTIPDIALKRKFELFIQEIYKISNTKIISPTSPIITDISWLSITWAKNESEFNSIIDEAIINGFIHTSSLYEDSKFKSIINITYKGRVFVESLGKITEVSNKVFMAFCFTDEMKESFEETTKLAVADASDGKLIAVRVSTSGTHTDIKIDDALITMLKSSKVVIADFTGQRQAVYYEAGYAMGMGIPVIWTCREDEVNKLSFDTRQYPHILWKDKGDLYQQLKARLCAQIL